jgi:fatty acid desaturase
MLYFKYLWLVISLPLTGFLVIFSPEQIWISPLIIALIHLVYDTFWPEYTKDLDVKYKGYFNALLYFQLPNSIFLIWVLLWQVTPGDLFNFGSSVEIFIGIDVLDKHELMNIHTLIICTIAIAFVHSSNTIVAHELTHRTRNPTAMFIGRWLLVNVFDSQFSISHVYGHHRNVATKEDPATARRGEGLYAFFIRSSIGQYIESWEIESAKLKRSNKSIFSFHNTFLIGITCSFIIMIIFGFFANLAGVGIFLLHCLTTKFIFESVNYIEHYGLVRLAGTKVEPRHSWDCYTQSSTFVFYNLSRHSCHHANANIPFWKLVSYENVPKLKLGYFISMIIAMIPFAWHRFMAPSLENWDNKMATEDERKLAYEANLESNHRDFSINNEY